MQSLTCNHHTQDDLIMDHPPARGGTAIDTPMAGISVNVAWEKIQIALLGSSLHPLIHPWAP